MGRQCDFCEKGTRTGNNVPRKGLSRRKGGGGQKTGIRTKRVYKANIQSKAIMIDGIKKRVRICTRCLRTMVKQTA